MSKIVIPVNDDLLSSSFNACTYFLIYEIKEQRVAAKQIDLFPDAFREKMDLWSERLGITDLIVHYIDEHALNVLSSTKINLFVGVKIDSPDKLVKEFLKGTLKSETHNILEKCVTR